TAQVDYHKKNDGGMYYASSFVGFFPADEPKYSCVVVVHKPNKSAGYYGADVAGPVFKRIAQKIFTDVPSTNEIKKLDVRYKTQEQNYAQYYDKVQKKDNLVPNVKGLSGMDAVAILENYGLKVKVVGTGKVKQQSLTAGQVFTKNQVITLVLS
ncbi:PASTA domain-containing protein, partial [Flavobacterium sp.]|uniref:PASTA domain-containing protein n=1 Tax=Flavobacterium sp. TaxID=239 RepID=UPI0028BE1EA9